jgi:hypothetical protein
MERPLFNPKGAAYRHDLDVDWQPDDSIKFRFIGHAPRSGTVLQAAETIGLIIPRMTERLPPRCRPASDRRFHQNAIRPTSWVPPVAIPSSQFSTQAHQIQAAPNRRLQECWYADGSHRRRIQIGVNAIGKSRGGPNLEAHIVAIFTATYGMKRPSHIAQLDEPTPISRTHDAGPAIEV